ncbi:MAG TPA: hypothetical protein VK465_02425 [Fibrobacteria bacterium]|nr:hypothetical protein [Fibrobacteria bacterium]
MHETAPISPAPAKPGQPQGTAVTRGFVCPLTPEWIVMWARLCEDPLNNGDPACQHPEIFEVWQYMGSVLVDGTWSHIFRHRHHPKSERREVRSLSATMGWVP